MFTTSFSEQAIDVFKTLSSIDSYGFYAVVPLLSCLPQHQLQPMPITIDLDVNNTKRFNLLDNGGLSRYYIPALKSEVL